MIAYLSSKKYYILLSVILIALTAPAFYRLATPGVRSDLLAHAHLAREMVENGGWLSYSVWYPIFHFASFGSENIDVVRPVIVILLTFFVLLKAWVVLWIANRYISSPQISALIAFVASVAMPIINPGNLSDIYLGQITANVWHNSTNVLVAPFAIAAFYAGILFLRELTLSRAWIFSGLIFACILCKPNFSLAFLPVLGIATIYWLIRQKIPFIRSVLLITIAYVPAALLLILQYVIVFAGEKVRDTTLSISPFSVWAVFSDNMSLSLILSIAGPALIFMALSPAARRSKAVLLSWFTLALAIAQFVFLVERFPDGSVSFEGNWIWGSYIAMTVLFVFSMIAIAKEFPEHYTKPWPQIAYFIAGLAIAAHVASGLYYLLTVGKSLNAL